MSSLEPTRKSAPITLYSWRRKDPGTGRWRVLRWKMTDDDAREWAAKEGAELERAPNSEEVRTKRRWPAALRMKRDLELIRKMVLACEGSAGGYAEGSPIEGYTDEQIGYHAYLICDAGLAKGYDASHLGSKSPEWRILHLTSAGHDFADAARQESTWRTATGIVKDKASGITLDVLKQILVSVIKGNIGLP